MILLFPLTAFPNPDNINFYKGWQNVQNNNPKKAIPFFELGIKSNPKEAKNYFWMGIAYYNLKSEDQALVYFSKAINANPKYAKAYYYKGLMLENSNNLDEALTNYNKCIYINPNHGFALFHIGKLSSQNRDYKKALIYFNKASMIQNDIEGLLYNRAITNLKTNNLVEAKKDLDNSIAQNPYFVKAYLYRSLLHFKNLNPLKGIFNIGLSFKYLIVRSIEAE